MSEPGIPPRLPASSPAPEPAEVTARQKFACPACGAEAHWNAGRQALVCPYCGTVSPAQISGTGEAVQEHDLVTALRNIPDAGRGWKAARKSVRCQTCQAISVLDPEKVAQRCDFCGSAQMVPYDQIKPPISPESVLPFRIDQAKVRDSIRQWYRSRWFAPGRFKHAALTDELHGIYLPYWTFDAQVNAHWTAQSGYHYYTTQTYRDANGRTQTRQVRHTRWQPSSGYLSHFFDDELVPGSRGADENLLRQVEPFPTREVTPYSPQYVAGWVVEQYQLDLVGAAGRSRQRMEQEIERMCASQVPGDTHRNLQVRPEFTRQTFKHVLLPIWLVSYNYGTRRYQVLVNGVTGRVAGKYPKSAAKILLLVLAVLVITGLIYLFIK